jgi:hypothetical protein
MAFENGVLKGIFVLMNDEIIGGWRKLRNQKRHNFHFPPTIIRMIKSGWIKWAGLVVHTEENTVAYMPVAMQRRF